MTKKSTHAADVEDGSSGSLIDDLRAIVRDAEELLRATEGHASERVEEIRARAQDSLEGAKERLRTIGDDAEEKVRSAARSTDDYVRENPWKAVAIAVGVGFLIGSLGRRR